MSQYNFVLSDFDSPVPFLFVNFHHGFCKRKSTDCHPFIYDDLQTPFFVTAIKSCHASIYQDIIIMDQHACQMSFKGIIYFYTFLTLRWRRTVMIH